MRLLLVLGVCRNVLREQIRTRIALGSWIHRILETYVNFCNILHVSFDNDNTAIANLPIFQDVWKVDAL